MSLGERIKRFRTARGMTQAQIARSIGVSEAAVRHYEHGIRTPKPEQIAAIAEVLEVSPEALIDYGIADSRDVIEILFRLEDAIGLKPVSSADGIVLQMTSASREDKDVRYAVVSWESMHKKLESGEISQDEYDEWRASYGNDA